MTKIADKDTAETARALYDALQFLQGSELGSRLRTELNKLKDDAFTRAMYGKTPQDQNSYFEGRGVAKAVRTIEALFEEIQEDGEAAISFMSTLRAKGKDEG